MSLRCAASVGPSPSSFSHPGSKTHYAAERPVHVQHVALTLELSFEQRSIQGSCVTRVKTVRPIQELTFDAVALTVEKAQVDGHAVLFANDGQRLTLELGSQVPADQVLEVTIHYRATPSRGIYFLSPDTSYPERPLQAWTQGQDEDARAWFPCLDAPAQKSTTELTATFPAAMKALSNGKLLEETQTGNKRTAHYRLDAPHPAYLMTLVVGDFEVIQDRDHGIVYRTFHPPGRKEDALRCVRRTPQMAQLFQTLTGQPYAFGDYAQAFVADFIFGGMENTSATTLTDTVLHDARAALDFSAESLIAHELAHQWFGDLLTCRDWPHGWLNEGFATYFEVLWKEHSEGTDEADQVRREELEAYLQEGYSRPIVERTFHEPIEIFDRHLYQKGGLVLHLLRHELGDALFYKALQHYVAQHKFGAVETVDLSRAIEEATGRNLDAYFDAYVYRAGHPSLKVTVRHESGERRVRVELKQEGPADAPPHPFTLLIQVTANGKPTEHRLRVDQKEHVFFLAADQAPSQVVVDPHRALLAALEVEKPLELWREELKHAPEARARTEAAHALGKDGSNAAVQSLAEALLGDRFWGTQAACAEALARVRNGAAKQALLAGLTVKHPKARRAVVSALGSFRHDAEVAEALRRRLQAGDGSYFVEGELARALGALRFPEDVPTLLEVMKRPAFLDVIAVGAIDGLAASGSPDALPVLLGLLPYGQPTFRRRAATSGLVKLGEMLGKKTLVADALLPLLRDAQFRVQSAALDAARRLGEKRLAGVLEEIPFADGRLRRGARDAVKVLRSGTADGTQLASLRDEVEKLKAETRKLKESLEALKPPKAGKPPTPPGKGPGSKGPPPGKRAGPRSSGTKPSRPTGGAKSAGRAVKTKRAARKGRR